MKKWLEFILKVLIVFVIATFWFKAFGSRFLTVQVLPLRNMKSQEMAGSEIVAQLETSRGRQPEDRQEVFRRLVQSYVQAGKEEYDKGLYEQAVKTFQMAEEYRKHLTPLEQEELRTFLEKARAYVTETKEGHFAELYRSSMSLYRNGQLEEARKGLAEVASSGSVPPAMKKTIYRYITEIDKALAEKTTPP